MIKISLLTLTICVFSTIGISAQTPDCPSGFQCIPQTQFNTMIDRLNELVESRTAVAKLLAERGASDAALTSALKVIDGWKELDAVNGQIILKQREVMELYERTIKLYAGLVESLEKQLRKPKSGFAKFLEVLKSVGYILAGVTLGRGL